jgi:preprotein translocase subunit SecA
MDYLKEGIGLRAMAQRDPLIEYQREGFDMFAAMMDGIKEEAVGYLFNVQVSPVEETTRPEMALKPEPDATEPASDAVPASAPNSEPSVTPVPSGKRARHAARSEDGIGSGAGQVPAALRGAGVSGPTNTQGLSYSGPDEDGRKTRQGGATRLGADGEPARNQPCPCGSGRKYKHCHGARTGARG